MSKPITINDIATLARWIEDGTNEDDTILNSYISDLQTCICDLVATEEYFSVPKGSEPPEELETLNRSCRLMARILSDMKALRREARTAMLLNGAAKQ